MPPHYDPRNDVRGVAAEGRAPRPRVPYILWDARMGYRSRQDPEALFPENPYYRLVGDTDI